MKIALLGSRGIPASYSGFETFYEQLATRLAKQGHQVTVYNRSHWISYRGKFYNGVELVRLPSIPTKHLDTITHTFISTLHALPRNFDIYYYCIVGNSPVAFMAKSLGKRVILNVDGADAERDKWKGAAKDFIRFAEKLAPFSAHTIIADSKAISKRYKEQFKARTVYIPYGANPWHRSKEKNNRDVLNRFSLTSDGYILFVSRMTPENKAHLLVEAFKKANTNLKLVLVGDAPYVDDYKRYLDRICHGDSRIVRTGYLWGSDYRQISCHARFFVLPSTIDGTRPVLLDQMAFGNCVVVSNNPAQQEVVKDCGLYFQKERPVESLAEVIELLSKDDKLVDSLREKAFNRVVKIYSWERITKQYEKLFMKMLENPTIFSPR
ncbi:MAG: glycosyltransferase [Thermodesulforhabdaceae bacterium]